MEIEFNDDLCIGCGQCVRNCPVKYLSLVNGKATPTGKSCIECGRCLQVCPVKAITKKKQQIDWSKKVTVAQFAPSIRVSIGEEFDCEPGDIVTEKLVAGLKKLGFDYVFDVAVGADFTTNEEVKELKEKDNFPALSSCCPAWVRYVHEFHPEYIKNLCTTRPPHIILGGIIKKYWGKKHNLKPEDITVVSIMPCTAKQWEANRPEMMVDNWKPVDYVLTTTETADLMKEKNINLKEIAGQPVDEWSPSGAGVIYGYSGGVFESAMRTGNLDIKADCVSGIENAEKRLQNMENYQAIEVMACPGGCINGGGQPLKGCIAKRKEALQKIDKASSVKKADDNPLIKEINDSTIFHINNSND